MKSKIPGKPIRIPGAFDITAHKTERTAVAILMHWMREIIEKKNLDLGLPDVETSGEDGKMPDTVIYESTGSQKVLCLIEAKQPYYDVFDEQELKEPARKKATQRKAKYFALTNFKKLIWFNTEKVNSLKPEEEQIIEKYHLSEIENLDDIEQNQYSEPIKRTLENFLTKLYAVNSGKEAEPKQAIDEFLIFRLQEKIRVLSNYYIRIIDDRCHKDSVFAKELTRWFIDQQWSFAWQTHDFDKAARQTAYLLVNKILFYNLLQAKRPHDLSPLEIPEGLLKGAQLQKILQSFFDEVLKIDYETIYTTDFIDIVAFPDAKEVVKEVKELVTVLKKYDFSSIGFDVIGRIFERLIPQDERHNLGQYFTNPDIVDLILRFCLLHEDDKILDPACGAGTFLVRAYQHKKLMNQRKEHEKILDTLWGVDIAKFPAHLSTINLAINDLGVDKNYPNIIREDFFKLLSGNEGFEAPENWRKARAMTLGIEERNLIHPRWFNAVVGNPPYTRQEEIPEVGVDKTALIQNALNDPSGKKIADISKRAGIHAYFFVHGTNFLQNGGRFGFIVSNSWLDVDYGKGLQEFFLKNYKIISVIESKVERWFEEADINTCIVILEKCSGEVNRKTRDENLVRFVYLKKPLRHFIPPAQNMWAKEVERLNEIDKLKRTIFAHNELYENEELRIFPKTQKGIWEEGFDPEANKYVGSKWSKYLRAPEIFFKILEKGKDKFVPLKEVAEVRFGIKTGANEFFYLTEEELRQMKIEKEFWMHRDEKGNWVPNYVIKSPRECKSIVVDPKDLKYRVLMIHKEKKNLKNTNVLKYIEKGERKGFHKRPTCASRGERWYELPQLPAATILLRQFFDVTFDFPIKPPDLLCDHTFYYLCLKSFKDTYFYSALLNSTLYTLITEIYARNVMGQGVLIAYGPETKPIPLLHKGKISVRNNCNIVGAFKKMSHRSIDTIFKELGASFPQEVSLDRIKPDRRELDKIIMGDILGLTDKEQLEVYRAVVDLVKSRIDKAKSFGKRGKTKEGINIDALVKTVMDKIGEVTIGKFYKEKVLSQKQLSTKKLPKHEGEIRIEQDLYGWRLYSGKKYIACESELEARYLKVWLEAGLDNVKIPKDEKYLKIILPELEALKSQIDKIVNSYLESILDPKTKARIEHQLWAEVIK